MSVEKLNPYIRHLINENLIGAMKMADTYEQFVESHKANSAIARAAQNGIKPTDNVNIISIDGMNHELTDNQVNGFIVSAIYQLLDGKREKGIEYLKAGNCGLLVGQKVTRSPRKATVASIPENASDYTSDQLVEIANELFPDVTVQTQMLAVEVAENGYSALPVKLQKQVREYHDKQVADFAQIKLVHTLFGLIDVKVIAETAEEIQYACEVGFARWAAILNKVKNTAGWEIDKDSFNPSDDMTTLTFNLVHTPAEAKAETETEA